MRISVKARYGLSAMICLAQSYRAQEYVTIISLAKRLDISKIYLEQVFSLLKRAELVSSTKGAQGGYRLMKNPSEITAGDILYSIETSMFEKTENTIEENEKFIESAMRDMVFEKVDKAIRDSLCVTLDELVAESEKQAAEGYMFYL
ncbi:Rrf2 family transcriptional regulator [Clostridia bacterium]|nr:Rrf2 family transcriptional regulator [Clostridia bacterium]GHU75356.1 Rrf2 family transcriptional regulator [Clostridia bacterium]